MSTVTLYSFESADGQEQTFTTFNPREAEEHARQYGLVCFANEYEYSDREVAWDFAAESADAE